MSSGLKRGKILDGDEEELGKVGGGRKKKKTGRGSVRLALPVWGSVEWIPGSSPRMTVLIKAR